MEDFETVWESLDAVVRNSTVSILVHRPEQAAPVQHGTGTLFRLGDRFFLITAAHVVAQAHEGKLPISIAASDGDSARVVRVRGGSHIVREPLDLALLPLFADEVLQVSTASWANQACVSLAPPNREDAYLIQGFPTAISEIEEHKQLEGVALFLREYHGPTTAFAKYQSEHHVLLAAKRQILQPMSVGDPPAPDRLNGISGAGVWRLPRFGADDRNPADRRAYLVGVQTGEYVNAGVIKATKWIRVFDLLVKVYPECSGAFGIHLRHRA